MNLHSFIDGEKPEKKVEVSHSTVKKIHKPQVPWIIKYLPQNTKGIIGREEEISLLKKYIAEFPQTKKRALFFCGPAGSGKTSCVHALAKELDFELFEVNASDVRNKASLLEILAPATKQKSFFYQGKIILVDEVDGLSGTKDRGGIPELARIIEDSSVPIILSANVMDTQKFKPILKISQLVAMEQLQSSVIREILQTILEKETITIDEIAVDAIKHISRKCDGDARAAINDLQMLIVENKVEKERFDMLVERSRMQPIESALATVLKGRDAKQSLEMMQQVKEDFDTQMLWIDYNVGKEYTKSKDVARAYGALAKADVFKRRIMKNQEWRFLLYAQTLAVAGVTIAKDEPYKSPAKYVQSTRLLKMWQVKMSNAKRTVIAQKLATISHCSTRVAFSQIDYYKRIFSHDNQMASQLATELDLDDAEVAWLRK